MSSETLPQPRQNLKRILAFHPWFKHMAFQLLFALAALTLYVFVSLSKTAWSEGVSRSSVLILVIFLSSFVLTYGAFLFWRSLAKSKVRLAGDHLSYDAEQKSRLIFYKDIVQFDADKLKFKLANGEEFNFISLIERPEYVVESIHHYNPGLISKDKFAKLRNELIVTDHDLQRGQHLKNALVILLLSSLTAGVFSLLGWWFGGSLFIQNQLFFAATLLFLASAVSFLVVSSLAESHIRAQKRSELEQSFLKTARNYSVERLYSHWKYLTYGKIQVCLVFVATLWCQWP